jgi:hypothetical protein
LPYWGSIRFKRLNRSHTQVQNEITGIKQGISEHPKKNRQRVVVPLKIQCFLIQNTGFTLFPYPSFGSTLKKADNSEISNQSAELKLLAPSALMG